MDNQIFDDFFGGDSYKIYCQPDSQIVAIDDNGFKAIMTNCPTPAPHLEPWPHKPLSAIVSESNLVTRWEYPPTLLNDLLGLRYDTVTMVIQSDGVQITTTVSIEVKRQTLCYGQPVGMYAHSYIVNVPTLISILAETVLDISDDGGAAVYFSTESGGVTLRLMTVKPTLGEIIRRNVKEYAETNNRFTESCFKNVSMTSNGNDTKSYSTVERNWHSCEL